MKRMSTDGVIPFNADKNQLWLSETAAIFTY
jgi:hypothetical protein